MVKLSRENGTVERYKRSLVEFWLFLINSLSMYGTRNTSCIVLELTTSQFCKLVLIDNIILKLYISSAMQKKVLFQLYFVVKRFVVSYDFFLLDSVLLFF